MVSLGGARGDKNQAAFEGASGPVPIVTEKLPMAWFAAGRRPISTPCGAPLETYNPGMFLLQGRRPCGTRV